MKISQIYLKILVWSEIGLSNKEPLLQMFVKIIGHYIDYSSDT
jgi:hypothetical protein